MTKTAAKRAILRVHPERAAPDELHDILASGLVAHVAVAEASGPVVIPMTYHFDRSTPDALYLHGATFGRLAPLLASGTRVCVTVTMLDGLVLSKTAKYHSVNYRSAVCFGRSREICDRDEKRRIGDDLIARYHPGRAPVRDYQVQPDAHVDATVWIAVDIEEASAKVRRGGPKGPGDDDPNVPGTAGLIEFNPHR
jgi:nitroimidazol reductase NimA-like FMN-containing flavoprotein (pyridoxamine 5'-phosphate oxidase superfamily)